MTEQNGPLKRIDNDSELIEAIQSGRKELFSELVRRYERQLYNFGFKMCA